MFLGRQALINAGWNTEGHVRSETRSSAVSVPSRAEIFKETNESIALRNGKARLNGLPLFARVVGASRLIDLTRFARRNFSRWAWRQAASKDLLDRKLFCGTPGSERQNSAASQPSVPK